MFQIPENPSQTLESKAIVRFQDCDPFRHLNNGKYLDYFTNAREDQLLKFYGLNIYAWTQETGKAWVSAQNKIAYLKPAFLMEKVAIESQLIRYSEKGVEIECRMYNADKTHLKAFLWANFAYFDLKKNSVSSHEKILMDLFEKIHNPLSISNFDQRIEALKKA